MDENFWKQRWANNEIAFHQENAHNLLVENFKNLGLEQGARILVPLCGKTLDIAWLLSKGFNVVGVELVQTAIDQLFLELGVEPEIEDLGELLHYRSNNIDIFVGDIFKLDGETLGKVDAIYDRAALVALPEFMREQYAKHLIDISQSAPQLIISMEYDQTLMDGPPFSVDSQAVDEYYSNSYNIELLNRVEMTGGFKGFDVEETVWLLKVND